MITDIETPDEEELESPVSRPLAARVWSSVWPKLAAIALVVAAWELVVLSGWKADYILPGPLPVFLRLGQDLGQSDFYVGMAVTLRRAAEGYAIALVIGSALGILVARVPFLRKAVGSAILGFQSMPSIAWFPLAILLFGIAEGSILFVIILGAAPSIAGGLLSGIDHVQPLLVRVGRMMGARGFRLFRHVILPAALPSFVGGMKQGWAFAWRSLIAGEILGTVSHQPSLGQQIQFARDLADAEQLVALIIVILIIGILIDALFGVLDREIRRRWGLSVA